MDDCIARGKALLDGGVEILGGTNETYGNINTSDALYAIKKLVFEERKYTLRQLNDAALANFEGRENALIQKDLLAQGKYGNDIEDVDALANELYEYVAKGIRDRGIEAGLGYYLIVISNNQTNSDWGLQTDASLDGRKKGMYMNPANNPVGGAAKNGPTACMNSLAKFDAKYHAGSVQNMKFTPRMMKEDEAKVDWYLRAACTRLPREECAAAVVKMYDEADKAGKEKLLSLLKQIGGRTALSAVVKAASDPEMADKATEVLGQWNTPEDAAPLAAACLNLAKSSSKYKTRAIRAYIRIPRQFDLAEDLRIKMAKIAFDTAVRPEDKQLIFEIFKRMITSNSVSAALSYADQPEYSETACETAVFIAEKIKGTSPELQESMKKVLETAKSQELKDRASKVLERQ